jgi:hypothetical protein
MQVRTITYKNLAGTYYLQGWISSQRMDDHIAEMLTDGWEILNSSDQAGDGRTFGPGVRRAAITMTFKKG